MVLGSLTNESVFPDMLLWVVPDAAFIYGGYLFLLKRRPSNFATQQVILLVTIAVMIAGFLIAPVPTEGNFAITSSLLAQLTFIPGLYVLWLLSFADNRTSTRDFGRSLPWQYKSNLLCWKISKFLYALVCIVLVAMGAYFMRGLEISTVPFLIATTIFGIPLLFNNPSSLLFGALWGLAIGILSPVTLLADTSNLNILAVTVMLGLSVVSIASTVYFSYTLYALTREYYVGRAQYDGTKTTSGVISSGVLEPDIPHTLQSHRSED
jgi:hypothetical protein